MSARGSYEPPVFRIYEHVVTGAERRSTHPVKQLGQADQLCLEAFSSTWNADGGTSALAPRDLLINTERVTALAAFARDRAAQVGLAHQQP